MAIIDQFSFFNCDPSLLLPPCIGSAPQGTFFLQFSEGNLSLTLLLSPPPCSSTKLRYRFLHIQCLFEKLSQNVWPFHLGCLETTVIINWCVKNGVLIEIIIWSIKWDKWTILLDRKFFFFWGGWSYLGVSSVGDNSAGYMVEH